jgi:hypothetical protein
VLCTAFRPASGAARASRELPAHTLLIDNAKVRSSLFGFINYLSLASFPALFHGILSHYTRRISDYSEAHSDYSEALHLMHSAQLCIETENNGHDQANGT